MMKRGSAVSHAVSPYSSAFTREQFLFYEMRTTAKLVCDGLTDECIVDQIVSANLFQYPTEKSLRSMALVCLKRLKGLRNETLIDAVANQSFETAKQICLYAMMKQYRIVWDFMITIVGEKYRVKDLSFGRIDLNLFFMRLQEQDDQVAVWSESTIGKLKQVITKILVENAYLDNRKSTVLNPVSLNPVLENEIVNNGDEIAFPAFNYFV